jgi:hypothetical protein
MDTGEYNELLSKAFVTEGPEWGMRVQNMPLYENFA